MVEANTWVLKGFDKTRRVAETVINRRKRIRVSTVFLMVDHNYFDEGPPIVFETMVFGGGIDGAQYRYRTWREAERGHACVVGYSRNARQTKTRKEKPWNPKS